jgi:predicted O-methyltransferase YrrM
MLRHPSWPMRVVALRSFNEFPVPVSSSAFYWSGIARVCVQCHPQQGTLPERSRRVQTHVPYEWQGNALKPTELGKWLAYRLPMARRLMAPTYPYKINPGQLAAMISLIDATRAAEGAVAEIGVAQGDSSVFFLEHLATTRDPRPLWLFDTFSGFTPASVEHETTVRGKQRDAYDRFRYGDEPRFRRNLEDAGYTNFRTVKGDAAAYDWAGLGPIGAVLLDIDLYQPTIAILEAIYPRLVPGGGIVLDDCLADTPWDGSLQAYEEFIQRHGLPFERVGHKGAVVRRP